MVNPFTLWNRNTASRRSLMCEVGLSLCPDFPCMFYPLDLPQCSQKGFRCVRVGGKSQPQLRLLEMVQAFNFIDVGCGPGHALKFSSFEDLSDAISHWQC